MTKRTEMQRSTWPTRLTSCAWSAYFRRNAATRLHIPWHRGAELTDVERQIIAQSVREFQLGESGEGRHFVRVAQQHACKTGLREDYDYLTALRLFIAEEQRHAADLGRFLDLAGIKRIERNLSNGLFRWLRHRAGLNLIISVLVIAELIAMIYYKALREATGSTVLRRLCDQILRDEVMHMRFQSQRLAHIRRRYPRWWLQTLCALHTCLFSASCLVVWRSHRRVLSAAGLSFREFWKLAHRELRAGMRLMDPRQFNSTDERFSGVPCADVSAPHAEAKVEKLAS